MSYKSSVARVVFVAGLLFSFGCGTKDVTTKPKVTPGRVDAGGSAGDPDPDGGGRCLVFNEDPKREPGQACACATDCTTAVCDQGVCCEGKGCGAKRPEGAPCVEAGQCNSGFCADGVCCNVACTGACLSCALPDSLGECAPVGVGSADPHALCRTDAPDTCGQSGFCNGQGGCAKYPVDTPCKPGLCDANGQFVPPSTCDGEGVCIAGVAISCSPSKCIGTECVRVCTNSNQCVAGKTCLDGSCGKFGPGQTCETANQCESGFCVDKVCCENACNGTCMTCGNPASRGKCVPAASGSADSACPTQAASTCGTNGKCDGMGECAKYDNNTTCRQPKCDAGGNVGTLAAKCDDGVCPGAQTQNCAPFKGCVNNACRTNCGADSQCTSGNFCNAPSCGKRDLGAKCNSTADCKAGTQCHQNICCSSACTGTCKSCAIPGKLGTCSNVPPNGLDPSGNCKDDACTNNVCNGSGACQKEPTDSACAPIRSCSTDGKLTEFKCTSAGACTARTPITCPGICHPTDGCIDKPPACSPACGGNQTCNTGNRCTCNAGQPPKECGSACVAANTCCPGTCDGPCDDCNGSGTCVAAVNRTCTLPGGGSGKCNEMKVCVDECVGKNCDDDNQCTTDGCSSGACTHTPKTGACTQPPGGMCVEGVCTGPTCTPAGCNDMKECTDDGCNAAGACTNTNRTGDCNGGAGSCSNGNCVPKCTAAGCNDDKECTTDACNSEHMCTNMNRTGDCDGGAGTCNNGNCVPKCTVAACNDNKECTTDACNSSNMCTNMNRTGDCDGGAGTCNDGNCVPKCTVAGCNDNKECTTDSCNSSHMCSHANRNGACDNGAGMCEDGNCVPKCTVAGCNDNKECTTDSCSPSNMCSNENRTGDCDGGDGTCNDGNCVSKCAGNPCDDDNPCTNDTCSGNKVCGHTDKDGGACGSGGTCMGGTCQPPTPTGP